MNIDSALEQFQVIPPGDWYTEANLTDWFAVVNGEGIIAYFAREVDACAFRLMQVNRLLNPLHEPGDNE